MNHRAFSAALIAIAWIGSGAGQVALASCPPPPCPGCPIVEPQSVRYIVKYRSDASGGQTRSGLLNAPSQRVAERGLPPNARLLRRMALGSELVTLSGRDRADVQRTARLLAKRADVEYVVEDLPFEPLFYPSDVRYSEQWSLRNTAAGISAEAAWDHFSARGGGSIIAVVDTGYTPHPDLDGSRLGAGYDFISTVESSGDGNGRDGDALDQGDGRNETCLQRPSTWHGTHVAGIAAAVGNNGQGISGVAPNANHLALRSLGRYAGSTSDIADAIVWAAGGAVPGLPANPNIATVINLSIGRRSTACGLAERDAINFALSRGVVVVAAAGNDALSASVSSPGSCPGLITVGATNSSAARASFSNYGALVEVYAPGEGILSTFNAGVYTPGAPSYASSSGTSMAAPMVAGVAAMMQAQQPRPVEQVTDIIRRTAKPRAGACSGDCGVGILDANAAAIATKQWPVANFSPAYTKSCPSTGVFMTNQSTDPDGGSLSYLWTLSDGRTSTQASPYFSLAPNTTITFTLRATDAQGHWTTRVMTFNNASCT